MKGRNLKNSELDELSAKVLKAGRLSSKEIDEIVSAPELFDSVRKRIAANGDIAVSGRRRFAWKPATAVFASILALVSAYGYFGNIYGPESAAPLARSRKLPNLYKVDETPVSKQLILPDQVSEPAATNRPLITKAVFREEAKPLRPKPKKQHVRAEREFYPLSFAGNLDESFRGGHIVRVDMTRSSLFALGVDLPLENDAKFIKTDVLVGTDGVPRAIRFVD